MKKTLTLLPLLALITLLVVAASMPKYVGKFYGDGVGLTNITGAVSPAQLVSATNLIYSAGTNAAKAYSDVVTNIATLKISGSNIVDAISGSLLTDSTVTTNKWDATALAWVNSKGTGGAGSSNITDNAWTAEVNNLYVQTNTTMNGTLTVSNNIWLYEYVYGQLNLTIGGAAQPAGYGGGVVLTRYMYGGDAQSSHGFGDKSSYFRPSGSYGYASFDSWVATQDGKSYDHIAGFQARAENYATLNNAYGFYSIPVFYSPGVVGSSYGLFVGSPTGTAGPTNVYGIYIDPQTMGTNNFSIVSAGTAPALFGGTLTVTNGYYMPTNALSSWPTAARTRGEAFWGNSNGWVYLLTSDGTAGTAWTKTNLIATP